MNTCVQKSKDNIWNAGYLLGQCDHWRTALELVPVPVLLLLSMKGCGSMPMAHRLVSQTQVSPGQVCAN